MHTSPSSSIALQCRWTAHFHGPSPFAPVPVVLAELFSDQLVKVDEVERAFDHLWSCSGMPQPSAEVAFSRSDALLFLGQAATQWALAALNEVRGWVVHAGARRAGRVVQVWLAFHHADISRAALNLALEFVRLSLKGLLDKAAFDASLKSFWQVCRQHHPDFQARILMIAASQAGIPFMPFMEGRREWQFGWGARSRVFFETATNLDGALGWQWQRNKVTAKVLMRSMGLPTPEHVLLNQEADLSSAVARVGMPCVIKPLDGGGGRGVTAQIQDMQSLHTAFHLARRVSSGMLLLEKHLPGLDYRLMVVKGQLVAAIERRASFLTGDGIHSVEVLLARLNALRSENLMRSHYLRPVATDAVLLAHLRSQGLSLQSVLPLNKTLTLRSNANCSTGGICLDVTDRLHPEVRAMAEQLALNSGLWAVGIDYLTPDISQSPWQVGGGFIEINATPGLDLFVAAGWRECDIGRVLLGEGLGHICVTLKVVSPAAMAGQLDALRSQILSASQGWVCGDQLRIGEASLVITPNRPWAAVRSALRNRCLMSLTVVCTGSDIERDGLPLDHFDQVILQDDSLPAAWVAVARAATGPAAALNASEQTS